MSKVKKNVFKEFLQEAWIPQENQYIVKYVAGKGNNLHTVEDIQGSIYLVSMPKKFRQTVWLKKNDCLVIDPIEEGNKVRGEIICVVPVDHVVHLINTGEWSPKLATGTETATEKDANNCTNNSKESVINFFRKHLDLENKSYGRDSPSNFSPTDSESETDTDTETDEDVQVEGEGESEDDEEELAEK